MSSHDSAGHEGTPTDLQEWVDAIADLFERAWGQGDSTAHRRIPRLGRRRAPSCLAG